MKLLKASRREIGIDLDLSMPDVIYDYFAGQAPPLELDLNVVRLFVVVIHNETAHTLAVAATYCS